MTPSTLSCPCFPTRAQFNHQFSPSWVRQNTDELFSYTVVWRKWKAGQVCGGWKQMLQYNVKLLQLSECLPRKCTIHITFEKGCRNIERRMLKCTRQPQKEVWDMINKLFWNLWSCWPSCNLNYSCIRDENGLWEVVHGVSTGLTQCKEVYDINLVLNPFPSLVQLKIKLHLPLTTLESHCKIKVYNATEYAARKYIVLVANRFLRWQAH